MDGKHPSARQFALLNFNQSDVPQFTKLADENSGTLQSICVAGRN